jgi:transcriptional regulator with XRE-family HTH domain
MKGNTMAFSQTITRLRTDADMSQQEVASGIGMARATYASLEAGRRDPTLSELRALSEMFHVTVSQLVEGRMDATMPDQELKDKMDDAVEEVTPRAIPKEKIDKFKNVLLYVLEKIGAKPNVGETVLYKLLYFIDFDYYERYGKALIGAQYIKNHYGPTPVSFKKVVERMEAADQLDVMSGSYFKYKQRKYMPRVHPKLDNISAQELEHINDVLNRLGDKSAAELSQYSHMDTPWLATKLGEPIDYQLARYRTTETSVKEPEDEL